MARIWRDVRDQAVDAGLIGEARVGELRARLRAEVRAHRLAEIRQAHGLDQNALAERLGGVAVADFPDRAGDPGPAEIATVPGYIEALGGEAALPSVRVAPITVPQHVEKNRSVPR